MDTFSAVLRARMHEDAASPLVTYYDEETGERVELSVATYANWVAKTASLFVDELDLERGDRVLLDLPTHWLGPVFLGAAWAAGLCVVLDGEPAEDVDAVVCGPAGVAALAGAPAVPHLATALLPMGARFPEPPPDGVLDFGVEVWAQPDEFVAIDPPGPEDEARPGTTQSALVGAASRDDLVATGDRLLTEWNPASPSGLHSFTTPLVRGGSTVWVRGATADRLDSLAAAERADVVTR